MSTLTQKTDKKATTKTAKVASTKQTEIEVNAILEVLSEQKNEVENVASEEVKVKELYNKKTRLAIASVSNFNEELNDWKRLQVVKSAVIVEGMGLNKMIKTFLEIGQNYLTQKQKECLTFENVKSFISESEKYKELQYFTEFQMQLICNGVIKDKDNSTKLAKKLDKQGGKVIENQVVESEEVKTVN